MVGGLQAAASLGWDQELWDNELAAAAAEGGQAAPEEPAEEQREEEDDELVEVAGAFDKEWTELSKSGPTSQTPPMSHLRKTDWLCTGLVCREEERRSLGLHCRQLVRQRPAEACALGLALQGLAEVREEARLGRGAVGQRARDGDQGRSLSNVFQCRGQHWPSEPRITVALYTLNIILTSSPPSASSEKRAREPFSAGLEGRSETSG